MTEKSEDSLTSLKVVELREELKRRSLSTTGTKNVLVARLQEFLQKEADEKGDEKGDEEVPNGGQEGSQPAESAEEVTQPAETVEGKAEAGGEEEEEGDSSEQPQQQEEEYEVMDQIVQTEEPTQEQAPTETEAPAEAEVKPEDAQQQEKQSTATEEPPTQEPSGPSSEEQPAQEEVPAPVQAEETEQMETTADQQGEQKKEESTTQPAEGGTDETTQPAQPVVTEAGGSTDDKPAEMETSTTQQQQQTPEKHTESGHKRPRDEDWDRDSRRDRDRGRSDPSRAPDPEEPEAFDESEVSLKDEFQPPEDDSIVTLDRFNSDLHFNIRQDGLGGCGLKDHGFANMWASAFASWGVQGGKYFYEVKVEENIDVTLPETEEHPHAIRCGWSVDDAGIGLGEAHNSYGYGGTGKAVVNNQYNEYGETYGPGDVIGCFLDLESSPGTISFSKNGTTLGTAFTLEDGLQGRALFPHIATKNVLFSLNFTEPALCEPQEGYVPIQSATEEHKVRAPQGPTSANDCEVLMMIGLPASGKTTWAEKHCRQNPEKRYTILGTNLIMDKMKVSGLTRKYNYHGRWEVLIKSATDILNKMFVLAAKNPRNYIIDQTNVYANAQRRKMNYFDGFHKKSILVIPPHHELRKRTAKRNEDMGQAVPDDAINAMKANFHIPKAGPVFEEVIYSEIYGPAAQKIVQQYREDALGIPSFPQSKRGRYEPRGSRYGPPGGGGGYRGGGGGGGGYGPPYRPYGYNPYSYGRSPYPSGPFGPPPPPPFGHPRGYGRSRPPYGSRPYSYGPPLPPRGGGYYGRY